MERFAKMSNDEFTEWLLHKGINSPDPEGVFDGDIVKDLMDDAVNEALQCGEHDNVNHPAHYTTGRIEVIEYIEDKEFPYHLGNAVKYISRAGRKDPDKTIEDLQKALWYIERYRKLIRGERGKK